MHTFVQIIVVIIRTTIESTGHRKINPKIWLFKINFGFRFIILVIIKTVTKAPKNFKGIAKPN